MATGNSGYGDRSLGDRAKSSAKETSELLAAAVESHRIGDSRSALEHCTQVVRAEPANVNALYLLGLIAHQMGQNDEAISRDQKRGHSYYFGTRKGDIPILLARN